MSRVVIGTRGSELARRQTDWVVKRLKERFPDLTCEVRVITTRGDADQRSSLASLGATGVFVKEIERALLAGEIDLAVHSLKDVPCEPTPGLEIAAIPGRADPRDALVGRDGLGLLKLPAGARLGTSSPRRRAQIGRVRPDLVFSEVRGNIDTRLARLAETGLDGLVLASAGLDRLGREDVITERLSPQICLPDPGQGALAIQVREGVPLLRRCVAAIDSPLDRACVEAERAFLAGLGGGCLLPVGALAAVEGATLRLCGFVATGVAPEAPWVRRQASGPLTEPAAVGRRLAEAVLGEGLTLPRGDQLAR